MKLLSVVLSLGLQINALMVVNEPSLTVYEKPEERGHIEDIIRYGTKVEVTDEKDNWVHIRYPGWQGWVIKSKLLEVKDDPETKANAFVGKHGAYLFKEADTEWGPFLQLPFETPLEIVEELPQGHRRWLIVRLQDGQTGYVQRSQLLFSRPHMTMSEMVNFSKEFLGSKYLWGGTTSFGYDCSGFVQMLYRQMGITLPRNANQQAVDSRFVDVKPEEAQAGDLVFFKNASGKVVHMGMMINDKEFIHPFTKQESWVCISPLADERWSNGHFYYGLQLRHLQ